MKMLEEWNAQRQRSSSPGLTAVTGSRRSGGPSRPQVKRVSSPPVSRPGYSPPNIGGSIQSEAAGTPVKSDFDGHYTAPSPNSFVEPPQLPSSFTARATQAAARMEARMASLQALSTPPRSAALLASPPSASPPFPTARPHQSLSALHPPGDIPGSSTQAWACSRQLVLEATREAQQRLAVAEGQMNSSPLGGKREDFRDGNDCGEVQVATLQSMSSSTTSGPQRSASAAVFGAGRTNRRRSTSPGKFSPRAGFENGTPLKQRNALKRTTSPRMQEKVSLAGMGAGWLKRAVSASPSSDKLTARGGGGAGSPRSSLRAQEPTLQLRLSMAMMAEDHGMAPGAADKWKVLQMFHESISRSQTRIAQIERIAGPERWTQFLDNVGGEEECEVGYYAPSGPSQLARLKEDGFSAGDFEDVPRYGFGVPLVSQAGAAHQRTRSRPNLLEGSSCGGDNPGERCLCVVLFPPQTYGGSSGSRSPPAGTWRELCVKDPEHLFLAYVIWYHQLAEEKSVVAPSIPAPIEGFEDKQERRCMTDKKRRLARQQREYAKVRDPLVKVALQGLERVAVGTMSTVLLPTTSVEAESVVSLYLLGGGGSRLQRVPGVDPREALGGVVVQRIENQPLFEEYCSFPLGKEGPGDATKNGERSGGLPRLHEDVVWHGTRLKRIDGEGASLATKLQSIAEKGFDPQRCMKGAAAEGGIWVATSPLASFGHGCDGLVAFVLCLAKTHFNEWVDATCARVLQRERVLPLYSLVHA